MRMGRIILAFIFAVATSHVLTSIAGTQLVLADIRGYGLTITLSERLAATFHDIHGLVPTDRVHLCAAAARTSFAWS